MKKLRAHFKRPIRAAAAAEGFKFIADASGASGTGPGEAAAALTFDTSLASLLDPATLAAESPVASASDTPAANTSDTAVEGQDDTPHGVPDPKLKVLAMKALETQVHELIDRNADGIRHSALKVRHETDLLLSIGIADPAVVKASSFSRSALDLANAGRGTDQQAERFELSMQVRADLVANAMALVSRAEALLAKAKRDNIPNIRAAISRQEQMVKVARSVLDDIEPAR